jgi:hypothetical protein
MFLSAVETAAIDASIAGFEARTGVPVVTAVVGKADTYAELPWMGFALGASLAAVLADWLRPALRALEVRHYAQALFLRRELFKTRGRNGILILVCKFARKIEIQLVARPCPEAQSAGHRRMTMRGAR